MALATQEPLVHPPDPSNGTARFHPIYQVPICRLRDCKSLYTFFGFAENLNLIG